MPRPQKPHWDYVIGTAKRIRQAEKTKKGWTDFLEKLVRCWNIKEM